MSVCDGSITVPTAAGREAVAGTYEAGGYDGAGAGSVVRGGGVFGVLVGVSEFVVFVDCGAGSDAVVVVLFVSEVVVLIMTGVTCVAGGTIIFTGLAGGEFFGGVIEEEVAVEVASTL